MVFQLNAKRVLLTYPRSDFSIGEFKSHAISNWSAVSGLVCSEEHEDGCLHRHALLLFDKPFRSRDPTCFDYLGRHPNIVSGIRSMKACIEYVKKGDDYISWGTIDRLSWSDIIDKAESSEDFVQLMREHYPKELILRYDSIVSFASKWFERAGDPFKFSSSFRSFVVPESIEEWLSSEFRGQHKRRRALILVSPSRYGKTEWARSLGKHFYFNGMVSFRDWRNHPGLEYVVFDDIPWLNVEPFKKQWFGCQEEFYVTDKYMPKKLIKFGVPLIYLCNDAPPLDNWMRENVVLIELKNKLF